jgi:hypothetical protein
MGKMVAQASACEPGLQPRLNVRRLKPPLQAKACSTFLLFLCCCASSLFAAIDGTVINGTTGKPQPSVTVTLVHPGAGGMQTLGSAQSDAEGKFAIDKEVPGPPALLQATYQGVTYNSVLPPGAPSTGVQLSVYDSTNRMPADVEQQHLLILEPDSNQLKVSETILIENKAKETFNDPAKGSLQLFIPPGTNTEVSVTAPGGMPIRRAPQKTSQADVFKIDYPLKPGETQFELSYNWPDAKKFSGKAVGKDPLRLVTANSVTLSGDGLKDLGTEPRTQAHVYEVAPGASYEVSIQGTGVLETGQAQSQDQDDNSGAPKVRPGMARVYDRLYWILGLAFSILGVGGALLYRKGAA